MISMYIENVDKLSSDSFNERELYEELLAIESDLDRQLTVNKLRLKAKQLGLASVFDTNWLGAQREYAKYQKMELAETDTIFSKAITDFPTRDTATQFQCGEWIADKDGIRVRTDKGGTTIVCPHPIYPTKVLRNAETGKYKVELEFKVRGELRHIYVNREVLASPSKILKLADDSVQVTALSAPYLVKYLSDIESLNPDLVQEYVSTSRLGWTDYIDKDNGGILTKRFLPYQQEIIFDNELSMKSLFDSIRQQGDRDKWYDTIIKERQRNNPELNVNLAASFASVLVEPCGALPFIVSLWGGTGIGKTVILKICTSVWADPGEGKYITDAKATNTAMEIRLNILNSLPMTLDDMAQIKNQYDEDFSELIYRWCAGKGRDRSNKELGLNKLTNWRNCTITNGERSMVDESTQGGAVNRVIDIEASGERIYDGKSGNRITKCIEKNFGFAGEEFIDLINEIGFDKVNEVYDTQYKRIIDNAQTKGVEKEDKQVVPMALILTADFLTEKYIFKDGITLNLDTCVDYLKNKGDVSEHERAYEYLMNVIAANRFRFADNSSESPTENIEQWGFWKGLDVIAINGNRFDRILSEGNFQSRAFLSWCKKKNLIEVDSKGKHKKTVKCNGQCFRAVVIRTDYGAESTENTDFMEIDDLELPFD